MIGYFNFTYVKKVVALVIIIATLFSPTSYLLINNASQSSVVHADDAWWDSNWTKRVKITFDNSTRGALTDFPVAISLNGTRVTYGDFKAAGEDVRFVDAGGSTVLNHEIEKWDTSGTSTIWAKIPEIASASSTDYIYMYYGNAGATSNATTTGVWDANYTAVQHFAEDPTGPSPQFQDSTLNDKDGIASSSGGAVVTSLSAGKFGNSLDFNGTSQLVDEGNAPLGSLPNGSAEFWYDIDSIATAANNRYLFSRVKSGSNDGELRIYVDTSGGANTGKLVYQIECTVPSAVSTTTVATASSTVNTWNHVVATWDDDTTGAMKLYVNGVQVGAANTTTCGAEATAVNTNLGRNNALFNGYLDGQMDELRVSTVARSADWIAASYASGIDTLNTYGSVETNSSPDVTAPNISGIATSTASTTATISWTTDENASSTLEYGTTTSYGTATSSDVATTSHSYTITGLSTSTAYHFRITVRDGSGNASTSADIVATTTAPSAPGQATGLTALGYETRAYLRWTAATGTFNDYKIEYKLSSEPTTWTVFSDGVSTATTTMVTGLSDGSAYDFRVTAVNAGVDGSPSATATATPNPQIVFVNPTIGQGNSTTSTAITGYASTTSAIPSYFTFRLETGGGALVSSATTSVRHGNGNLAHLTELSHKQNLSITGDMSGQVYVPTTDTLFTVHNGQNIITEITRAGVATRTIACTACGDIEDITLVSSIASTTALGVYDHTFMISTEDAGKIFKVTFASVGNGLSVSDDTNYYNTGIAHGANDGLEAIAYDSVRDQYYTATEGDTNPPARLYRVTLGVGTNTSTSTMCTNLDPLSTYVNDISGMDYATSTQMLYILSHESDKMYQIDISNPSVCGTPTPVGGIAVNMKQGVDVEMAEGISWDSTLDYLYISAEADYWSVWRTNAYTVQKGYTGLSSGSYNLYTSVTDTYGNTSTSTARSFTIGADATAPTITNVSSDKANGSYGVGEVIDIDVTFSENVTSTGNVTMTLETGATDRTCTFSVSNANTGTCNYTVQAGDNSSDLTVASISGTIADQSANAMSNFVPATNLAANKALVVDGVGPVITLTGTSSADTVATTTWTTDESSNSKIVYGTSADTYTLSSTSAAMVTNHSLTLTGLTAATTYYFRVVSVDALSNISTSSESTFTTAAAPDTTAPNLSGIASSTTAYTATVQWNTNESASGQLDYGLTAGYGTATTSASLTSSKSFTLTGLTPNTVYHFRITALDGASNSTTSADYVFKTISDTVGPVISNVNVAAALDGATITWTTDENATSSVSFGTSTSYGSTSTSSANTSHSISITGLTEGLLQHYQIYARDLYANVTTTVDATFTTSVTPAASPAPVGPLGGGGGGSGGGVVAIAPPVANLPIVPVPGCPPGFVCVANPKAPLPPQNGMPVVPNQVVAKVFENLGKIGVVIRNIQSQGKRNAEIINIQKILNADPATRIAPAGPGSPGKETNLFGPATRAAVQKFQLKYGIVKSPRDQGYGVVGPKTKAKMNELLGK